MMRIFHPFRSSLRQLGPLEQCLLGLEERGPPLPSLAQPVLARAIAGLHALTARVRGGFDPQGVLNAGRMWAGV